MQSGPSPLCVANQGPLLIEESVSGPPAPPRGRDSSASSLSYAISSLRRAHDSGASPLSCAISDVRHDAGVSLLSCQQRLSRQSVSSQRCDPGPSSLIAADQRRLPVCSGGASASTSSSFTTVSTLSTPCMPSLGQRYTESSTNGDAFSSSSSAYFSNEAGPSPLCLANRRHVQLSPREMLDRDTDSSSEPMVPSPPAIEDMDVVVRELLLSCDNWG